MTKKNTDKLTISLKREDEAELIKVRGFLENKYGRQFSLAEVVRHVISRALSQDNL